MIFFSFFFLFFFTKQMKEMSYTYQKRELLLIRGNTLLNELLTLTPIFTSCMYCTLYMIRKFSGGHF